MFSRLDLSQLQQLWWIIIAVVGSLFLFLSFVQGGQTLLFSMAKNDLEKSLVVNSLGRKWKLTFTTLVLLGGALFAAFPLFYATSFGGAYWVWILILFTFILQAVSYEFRRKPGNLLGAKTYEIFLFANGSLGLLLFGAAIGTIFTGSDFELNAYHQVTWQHAGRGLEAAANPFNLALGLFLVFLARVLGALYLANNIIHQALEERTRKAAFTNLVYAFPFLGYVLVNLMTMDGYGVDPATGLVTMVKGKYLTNLLALPVFGLGFLLGGLVLVIWGVAIGRFKKSKSGIWFAGPGVVLIGMAIFFCAGFNDTAFYPSRFDPGSSLTIHNASSSRYTLIAMSYVALAIPMVFAYVGHVWHLMDTKKMSVDEVRGEEADEMY